MWNKHVGTGKEQARRIQQWHRQTRESLQACLTAYLSLSESKFFLKNDPLLRGLLVLDGEGTLFLSSVIWDGRAKGGGIFFSFY